jgi:hypothetical protein
MAPREGERLYAAAAAVEKELRALLQPGPGHAPGDAAASALRQRLCESYEAVLFADYAFSQARAALVRRACDPASERLRALARCRLR